MARVVIYLVVAAAAVGIAFSMGAGRYEKRYCTAPDISDCDPALGAGGLWAFAAAGIVLGVVIVIEVPLYLRRRRERLGRQEGRLPHEPQR